VASPLPQSHTQWIALEAHLWVLLSETAEKVAVIDSERQSPGMVVFSATGYLVSCKTTQEGANSIKVTCLT
jgi:hypothetical protein